MSGAPPISIGLPVHDGERYIRESIDSVLAQTLGDFELVIADNASTDGTEAICRDYAARDRRVRYHRGDQNRGAAHNYNRAFELSRGEYFKWQAADDLIGPRVLERCAALLAERKEAVLAYPTTRIIDEGSRVVRDYDDRLDVHSARPCERFSRVLLLTGECNAVFGLIRSAVLRRTQRIGCYVGSDVVLLGELALYGTFQQLGDCFFFRRDHPRASSRDKSFRRQMEFYGARSPWSCMLPNFRHQKEYLKAIWRTPLARAEKLRCARFVLRRAHHIRHRLGQDLAAACRYVLRSGDARDGS